LGYTIKRESIRAENGEIWDGHLQDGDKVWVHQPIHALLIYRDQEAIVKMGWDKPLRDIEHHVYQKWRLMAH
jgi:hypothetical protein